MQVQVNTNPSGPKMKLLLSLSVLLVARASTAVAYTWKCCWRRVVEWLWVPCAAGAAMSEWRTKKVKNSACHTLHSFIFTFWSIALIGYYF